MKNAFNIMLLKRLLPLFLPLWLTASALMAEAPAGSHLLTVSAAISLKEVLTRIADDFQREQRDVRVQFNFAASGQLRAQIENGAPADLFIPASTADLDLLTKKGLLRSESRTPLAGNELVLVVNRQQKSALTSVMDLASPSIKRIALGNPDTVPAGKYAKETLEFYQMFAGTKSRLIYTENVRQVLDYVARDEVDAGFVFATDAMLQSQVKLVARIANEAHTPIVYAAAVLKSCAQPSLADAFLHYAATGPSRAIWNKYGFKPTSLQHPNTP